MVQSIVPVLTKVNPADSSFDFGSFKDSLFELVDKDLENYRNHLMSQANGCEALYITDEDIDKFSANQNIEEIDKEKQQIVKEYFERKEFLTGIIDQLVICDPLDRCDPELYPAMDHESVLTVEQLKERIMQTPSFQGGDKLQLSLSEIMYDKLEKMIEQQWVEIQEFSQSYYLDLCDKYGQLHEEKFQDLPAVKDHQKVLNFFLEE